MHNTLFRRLFATVLFTSYACLSVQAQTTPQEKQTDRAARKAIGFMNNNQPDSVYTMAGQTFRNQINAALWNSLFKAQFSQLLPFNETTFIRSRDGVNEYKLKGKADLSFFVSLDEQGKLKDFLFKPYQAPATAQASMTTLEKKTDTVARKVLALMNAHQTDSLYQYAGEHFKSQIDGPTFKNICETGLFTLTPLAPAVFVNSKNGINKYRLDNLQFIISLDQQGKYDVLALQPYQEEARKTTKALSDNVLKTQLDSVVDKVVSAYIQTKGNVGVSVAVYYKGAAYYYNYGETKQGNNQLPTRNTLYDIGSITKTFTSTLLAMAVNSKKVTLQTPITQLLPDSVAANPALKSITLVQLANHTSGLPRLASNMESTITDANQPYGNYDIPHLFAWLKQFKPTREPGTQYEYSNLGAALLGVLLERAYHQPYMQLVSNYILKPVQMTATTFTIHPANAGHVAQGYNEQLQPVSPWEFKAFAAAGGLKSSTADMLRYAKLQLLTGSTPLNRAVQLTHQITYQDSQNIVGLGWHYLGKQSKVVQHSGSTGGYMSLAGADLEKNFALVVLTNNTTGGDAVGIELIQALRRISK